MFNVIRKYLKCIDSSIILVDTLQQNNGYDCGIHVLCNIDQVTRHICNAGKIDGIKKIAQSNVASKREELIQIIRDLGGRID